MLSQWNSVKSNQVNIVEGLLKHICLIQWLDLTQMTIISTIMDKNPLEEME